LLFATPANRNSAPCAGFVFILKAARARLRSGVSNSLPLLSVAIGSVDALIVVAYVIAAASLGIVLGRGQADNREFFLADHRLPTWALLLSIVATETSTVTFLSVPGLSFIEDKNFTFLQVALGYIVGRLAIVAWLLPGYFRGEMLTAYQVLEQRYGVATRRLASLVFLVMRNLADGLRLLLAAMVLNTAFGLDYLTCVLVISAATAVYSCCGGVRSVVWNDCLQFGVYMIGALAVCYTLFSHIPGGWQEMAQFGESTGRWRLFDFDPSLVTSHVTFWSGLVGGAFLALATHGADHMMVQRYLCATSQASASKALALSGVVVFLQFAFFLFIGVELAWFFAHNPPPSPIEKGDQALVTYVVNHTGTGLRGLVLAAVFSASMSSSLNSVTSSLMNDWFAKPLAKMSDRQSLRLARLLTLVFACIQAAVAIGAYQFDLTRATVNAVLGIAGFSTGLILGLYFLGLIAPKTSEKVALAAFAAGTIVTCYVAFGTDVHYLWYTLVGSGTIVVVGLVLSSVIDRVGQNKHVSTSV
jgi:SSS family transporter